MSFKKGHVGFPSVGKEKEENEKKKTVLNKKWISNSCMMRRSF